MSALGANRKCRVGGNDVNDPTETFNARGMQSEARDDEEKFTRPDWRAAGIRLALQARDRHSDRHADNAADR
jgi:hypothetical protein